MQAPAERDDLQGRPVAERGGDMMVVGDRGDVLAAGGDVPRRVPDGGAAADHHHLFRRDHRGRFGGNAVAGLDIHDLALGHRRLEAQRPLGAAIGAAQQASAVEIDKIAADGLVRDVEHLRQFRGAQHRLGL